MAHPESANRKWAAALLVVAAVFLFSIYILPALANQSDGSTTCENPVKSQQRTIATGQNPGGRIWKVRAFIQGGCNPLLGWEFLPSGVPRGSWIGKWAIPVGGHLSEAATIDARDEASDSSRVFSGVVGGDVRVVSALTKSGKEIVIRPKLPRRDLRQNLVWLRQVRYFMRFYPVGDAISRVRLLDGKGNLKYSTRGFEGDFQGPMGSP